MTPPQRINTRLCPQCSQMVSETLNACRCCGVSVCGGCMAAGHVHCQTCATLGVPRTEPTWVRRLRESRKDLKKVRQVQVSENQRYGVLYWNELVGERLLVFDLWHGQVVVERRGHLFRPLKPKGDL